MAKARGDFTDLLLKKKLISPDQLSEAESIASATGIKLQDALVKQQYLSANEVMSAVAEHNGLQFVDMTDLTIPKSVIELVPESVARENVVLPLELEGNTLKILTADPTNYDTVQKLQFILNKDIVPVLAVQEQIQEAINKNYGQTETESVDSLLVEFTDTAIEFTQTETAGSMANADDSDAPVVRLVNLIISEAISLRASDIHIEPFADRVRVRYRIDGVLVERDAAPRRLLLPLLSRLKIMGSIDISEKRRPQDGRIKMTVSGKHFDLRVSMLPSVHGQSAVMRILDRGNIQVSIKDLGFAEDDYIRFQQIIKRPNGIFLVTGPTGSGKTTSLASMINFLNDNYDRHIITLEDPIEYFHKHKKSTVNQREIGIDVPDFKEGLRRALRMDPDCILVGEMRDLETIRAALEAAETGHLVFGTLHTSGAASTVDRVVTVFPENEQDQIRTQLAGSLIGVLSQALLPRKPEGLIAAYEMMVVTAAIRNLIRENKTYRINSSVQTGRKHGMFLLDDALFRLWREDLCEKEEVLLKANQPNELAAKIAQAERGLEDDDEEGGGDEEEEDDDDDDDDQPRRRRT